MAHGDKPYRVYRGGRKQGTVPLKRKSGSPSGSPGGSAGGRASDSGGSRKLFQRHLEFHPRKGGWRRRILIALSLLFLLGFSWALASYFALRSGAQQANERLSAETKQALSASDGLMMTTPTNTLVLGTDHANTAGRQGSSHSDSIMLLHTDPDRQRIVYLSIPRDLRVEVPDHGSDRINAAFQNGGAPLAIRTVAGYTGLPINHVIVVDFGEFRELIDALGGVDVNVPKPILTNSFDCPYSAERCLTWQGYRFSKGVQHMDGRRALIYSRIRKNQLDAGDTDVSRGSRQQQIVQAVLAKITGVKTMLQLPWLGGDLLRPLATDLSAAQLMQLGWIKLRASTTLHCRLGGDPQTIGGASELVPVEENFSVIRMVEGTETPRAPTDGASLYEPGCSKKALLP